MYWFEQRALRAVIDQLADNLMFETDFPHATSLSPGPASESPSPREVMERSLGELPDEVVGKVLQHTATKLYKLEAPVRRAPVEVAPSRVVRSRACAVSFTVIASPHSPSAADIYRRACRNFRASRTGSAACSHILPAI
jgi:hypothetical protein